MRGPGILARSGAAAAALVLSACGSDPAGHDIPEVSTSPGDGAARWVDPFIGTGDSNVMGSVINGRSGSTFPGAALPFGMVQWSPDTAFSAPPGYYHPDDTIVGFSLTHLNGAGCMAMRDFPVMPIIGALDPSVEPAAKFTHEREIASPGFYEVTLDSGVRVDLTATLRTGLARFTFPRGADAKILLAGSFDRDRVQVFDFHAGFQGGTVITGHRKNGFFCASNTAYDVYFAARFNRPFTSHGAWSNGEASPGADEMSGLESGLFAGFDTSADPVVHMKIGISYVSEENAAANLDAESQGWDFDAVHEAAIAEWNKRLGRVEVEGGTDGERRSFYTALYHAFLQPGLASDANGDHLAFGGAVVNDPDHARYAQFSGWDIYRSWIQLAAMILPDETSEMMRSLVTSGTECGALPKWPLANQESSTMVGDPAAPLVAGAWAFGARGFDADAALALLTKSATDPAAACDGKIIRDDLANYLTLGYCPIDASPVAYGPVSTTLEYAISDFAIAELAAGLGDTATHDAMLARGRSWQNVFDPDRDAGGFKGYVQPRMAADMGGAPQWKEVDVASDDGFVEGSAAQYTWMVPHDVPGLVAALGGEDAARVRLDAFFTELNAGTDSAHLYIGNEPGFAVPWAHAFVGAPWKTQALVRRIQGEAFAPTPEGLPGNDDLGATSSWLAWSMLGMYPAIPGVSGLVLGSPTFPKVTITLAGGAKLVIVGAGASSDASYVQSLRVNGQESTSSWLPWDTVAAGGTIEFTLGATPNESFGAGAADRPPAFYP